MTINIDSEVSLNFDFDHEKAAADTINACLDNEKCPYETQVDILITDDENIRSINKENRNIDRATDVLSFPMIDYERPADFSKVEEDPAAFDPESGELMLGSIVLSIDHIISQADEYGHCILREYMFLIIHSMLHLMGYDHMEEADRILMEEHQREVLKLLYLDYPEIRVD